MTSGHDRGTGEAHFSCSLTAVLLGRIRAAGGAAAVADVLTQAGSSRSVEYLSDTANWVSYDEAVALWAAGARVTHHPGFARVVGEDAARALNASPVATLLRSLGSPEAVYAQIALTSPKFAVVTTMEAVDVGPGYAEIEARSLPGFPRSADHCAWTTGLLTQPPVLFGLPPATVEHEHCEVLGAPCCRYVVRWSVGAELSSDAADAQRAALEGQLEAMRERLRSMFATAADLIGAEDIGEVLARITDRAAIEVRAPRYLLCVQTPAGTRHCHHKGFAADEAQATAAALLDGDPDALPDSWLVVPVRSRRHDYGWLVAVSRDGVRFFPQERELFGVYAQYAASALDSATALMAAQQRSDQASALLDLARALAGVSTSDDVAARLAEAVPRVVDCDRVGVYLWDAASSRLRLRSWTAGDVALDPQEWSFEPQRDGPLERMLQEPLAGPVFIDAHHGHPRLQELAGRVGALATIAVPLATAQSLLGLLVVWVTTRPERLQPSADLLDRLSGVAAQATSALQNGRLVDQITHQARHDQLTGLANRLEFTDQLRAGLEHARAQRAPLHVLYLDLDGFKPVNDEFGHELGDRLLEAVGQRLRTCARASDTVARLGGDEFAVIIDVSGSGVDAERLRDRFACALQEPFGVGEHRLSVGASIGVATFPLHGDDAESLLRYADAAMFAAKHARRSAGRADAVSAAAS